MDSVASSAQLWISGTTQERSMSGEELASSNQGLHASSTAKSKPKSSKARGPTELSSFFFLLKSISTPRTPSRTANREARTPSSSCGHVRFSQSLAEEGPQRAKSALNVHRLSSSRQLVAWAYVSALPLAWNSYGFVATRKYTAGCAKATSGFQSRTRTQARRSAFARKLPSPLLLGTSNGRSTYFCTTQFQRRPQEWLRSQWPRMLLRPVSVVTLRPRERHGSLTTQAFDGPLRLFCQTERAGWEMSCRPEGLSPRSPAPPPKPPPLLIEATSSSPALTPGIPQTEHSEAVLPSKNSFRNGRIFASSPGGTWDPAPKSSSLSWTQRRRLGVPRQSSCCRFNTRKAVLRTAAT
mmetsp:Transcript_121990/g.356432  ORF Transcript_121990/g.356432 Transcript_121990/m.356432 type:complete len:353 (+) Transcript_121990:390-1448(+)